jgi:hypothetical protein
MNSMVPIYQYLIDGGYGLNILVYSGDDDSVCATVGTQDWIWDMGYNVYNHIFILLYLYISDSVNYPLYFKVSGRAWQTYTVAGQTAGYSTKWENTKLGFVTVHGAGHEVIIFI